MWWCRCRWIGDSSEIDRLIWCRGRRCDAAALFCSAPLLADMVALCASARGVREVGVQVSDVPLVSCSRGPNAKMCDRPLPSLLQRRLLHKSGAPEHLSSVAFTCQPATTTTLHVCSPVVGLSRNGSGRSNREIGLLSDCMTDMKRCVLSSTRTCNPHYHYHNHNAPTPYNMARSVLV